MVPFIQFYKEQLRRGICPYCEKPFSRMRSSADEVFLEPCGCLLYRTLASIKVIRLNDWSTAKAAYINVANKVPDLNMPFERFFEIMLQRKCQQTGKRSEVRVTHT